MPATPFQEDLPLHHTSTPFFLIFQIPPLGEVIKIYSSPSKKVIINISVIIDISVGGK